MNTLHAVPNQELVKQFIDTVLPRYYVAGSTVCREDTRKQESPDRFLSDYLDITGDTDWRRAGITSAWLETQIVKRFKVIKEEKILAVKLEKEEKKKEREAQKEAQKQAQREANKKLMPSEASDMLAEAFSAIDTCIAQHIIIAPVTKASRSLKAYYRKEPVHTGYDEFGDAKWWFKYRRICDATQINDELICEMLAEVKINSYLEETWKMYCDCLGSYLPRLGNSWMETISPSLKRMRSGQGQGIDGPRVRPIPFLPMPDEPIGKFCTPYSPVNDCSDWNFFLERCTDPLMVCCWFAKLFTPGDTGRQAMVLRGPGQSGTTAICTALEEFLGDYLCKKEPVEWNQFTANHLAGAEMITAADIDDSFFLMQQHFKQRTGGDTLSSEQKNGPSGSVHIYAKMLVTTNRRLFIDPLQRASTSRVIMIDIESVPPTLIEGSNIVVSRLVAQLPFFISKCLEVWSLYRSVTGADVDIPLTPATQRKTRESWDAYALRIILWLSKLQLTHEAPFIEKNEDKPDDYIPHNILTRDMIGRAVASVVSDIPLQHIREGRERGFVGSVFQYIKDTYGLEEKTYRLSTLDGTAALTVSGFSGCVIEEYSARHSKTANTSDRNKNLVALEKLDEHSLTAEVKLPRPVEGVYLGSASPVLQERTEYDRRMRLKHANSFNNLF